MVPDSGHLPRGVQCDKIIVTWLPSDTSVLHQTEKKHSSDESSAVHFNIHNNYKGSCKLQSMCATCLRYDHKEIECIIDLNIALEYVCLSCCRRRIFGAIILHAQLFHTVIVMSVGGTCIISLNIPLEYLHVMTRIYVLNISIEYWMRIIMSHYDYEYWRNI